MHTLPRRTAALTLWLALLLAAAPALAMRGRLHFLAEDYDRAEADATVQAIVRGDQDAHFIRPKPSFVTMVRNADLLIATGLDLAQVCRREYSRPLNFLLWILAEVAIAAVEILIPASGSAAWAS